MKRDKRFVLGCLKACPSPHFKYVTWQLIYLCCLESEISQIETQAPGVDIRPFSIIIWPREITQCELWSYAEVTIHHSSLFIFFLFYFSYITTLIWKQQLSNLITILYIWTLRAAFQFANSWCPVVYLFYIAKICWRLHEFTQYMYLVNAGSFPANLAQPQLLYVRGQFY